MKILKKYFYDHDFRTLFVDFFCTLIILAMISYCCLTGDDSVHYYEAVLRGMVLGTNLAITATMATLVIGRYLEIKKEVKND